MSHTHRRHIGDTSAMFSTCSRKHRRCIFVVIVPRMIWVIHRRFSPTALRSIGDTMAMFSPVCSIFHPAIRQQNKGDLFIHDLILQPQGIYVVPRKIPPPFICYPQGTMPLPCRHKDITTTSLKHNHYAPDVSPYLSVTRRRNTNHRRF